MTEFHRDPEMFHRMSEPFDGKASADAALDGFMADVKAAREKHRIRDVALVIEVACVEDGKQAGLALTAFYGDSTHELPMFAYAYGRARQAWEKLVRHVMGDDS